MTYFVYVLLCKGGTYYTGITNDLKRRYQMHEKGTGAKYTRSHPPIRYVYTEACSDKSSALKREHELKQLSHSQKALLSNQATL